MPLTLIRHTQPDIEKGICYGQSDIDVAASFEEEAAVVARQIEAPFKLVSSNLLRCRKLANYLADTFRIDATIDARLTEMDFGKWEGIPWSNIARSELDAWAADFLNARPHGGESVYQMRTRVIQALTDYSGSPRHTVIITHAGVIKTALAKGDTSQDFQSQIAFGECVSIPTNLFSGANHD